MRVGLGEDRTFRFPPKIRSDLLAMLCLAQKMEGSFLAYFSKGIAKTQAKRDHKATLLASIQAGDCEPSHGMTKDEAIIMLCQDIADYDEILIRLRSHDEA
jgi:hypothetical protein